MVKGVSPHGQLCSSAAWRLKDHSGHMRVCVCAPHPDSREKQAGPGVATLALPLPISLQHTPTVTNTRGQCHLPHETPALTPGPEQLRRLPVLVLGRGRSREGADAQRHPSPVPQPHPTGTHWRPELWPGLFPGMTLKRHVATTVKALTPRDAGESVAANGDFRQACPHLST